MEKCERKDVYKVYDKIADWFFENRYTGLLEKKYLDKLLSSVPANATILDLGCGTGKPIMEYLLEKNLKVTGIDASSKMLEIARRNFPQETFIEQDMRLLDLNKKFDAIIAWDSFFHLPPADQPQMFARFKKYLNLGGILIFTSGTQHGEAWGLNGGENLFHGSLDTTEYQLLLNKHNFKTISHTVEDPECCGATVWVAKYTPADN